ncbi:MAG: protein kinase [Acidobacteriota bacterium]|nr:protein kinase [Acidobacteriota bacterium]
MEKLGAGGMGEVYLAEDTRLGRKLALKILPAEYTQNPDRLARFEQEARAASALNHPNIITVYEIGEEADVHFIAFEFIPGRTLRFSLKSGGMDLREVLEISIQIISALQAAHEAGITHRDIKPENVMIRPDGYVKVLDFGLAKLTEKTADNVDVDAETRLHAQTEPGTVMGTVTYMSPEQARGVKVDGRSDIFSVAVLLYEMITGRLPFAGKTASDVIAAILLSEPPPPSHSIASIPAELDWSLSKALRKDCEERYQTIKSFLSDLKHIKSRLEFETELARLNRGEVIQAEIRGSGSLFSEAARRGFSGESNTIILPAGYSSLPQRSSGSLSEIDSLAILPLANACSDPGMEYLSEGITESIINSLSQLPKLRVIPRSTVFRYKGTEVDPQQAGRELNVRAVLTGRVLQLGDSLIVKTELIDVVQQSQLWGEQYRRRLTDIFALQEEIAEDISRKLRLRLTGEERERMVKRYTDNTAAYHLYLKGRHYAGKRTPEWLRKGVEHFQQAIDLDPNYGLAYAGLADAFAFLASSTGGQPPHDTYPKAKAAAQKALELDETLGEAHCSLGFSCLLYDWNFAESERQFKRAIELTPDYANAHDGYAFYLKATGQHDAAIRECQRAQELDPLSLFTMLSLSWAYYFARRYDDALAQVRRVMEMDPNFGFAHWHLGMIYLQKGKHDDAITSLRKAVNLTGGIPTFLSHLGHAYGKAGKHREARQMLTQLESLSKRQYVSSYFLAMIHLGLGDPDRMFECLEKAYEERSGSLAFLRVEPILDGVRKDPRFATFDQRMNKTTA